MLCVDRTRKGKRTWRSIEFKLSAIASAKETSNKAAAIKLGLPKSTIRHWRKMEEQLKQELKQVD